MTTLKVKESVLFSSDASADSVTRELLTVPRSISALSQYFRMPLLELKVALGLDKPGAAMFEPRDIFSKDLWRTKRMMAELFTNGRTTCKENFGCYANNDD